MFTYRTNLAGKDEPTDVTGAEAGAAQRVRERDVSARHQYHVNLTASTCIVRCK